MKSSECVFLCDLIGGLCACFPEVWIREFSRLCCLREINECSISFALCFSLAERLELPSSRWRLHPVGGARRGAIACS